MNNNQHTRKQHFVPRFLMKRFSFDGKHVWVLDRRQEDDVICIKNIESICFENDLYDVIWEGVIDQLGKYVLDNQIEEDLADLENGVALLLERITAAIQKDTLRYPILENEKQKLAEFVVTLYLRNPYILKRIVASYDGVENESEARHVIKETDMLFQAFQWGSAKSLIDFSKKAGIFNKEIEGSPFNVEYQELVDRKCAFWYSCEGGFLTASFPLFILSDNGKKRIVFPISSNMAVVFYETGIELDEGVVLHLNKETIDDGMKWFYQMCPKEMSNLYISKDETTVKQLIGKT